MRCPDPYRLLISAALLATAGCRMGVPIHVWQPPELESVVGKQVVVSTLAAKQEVADQVKQQLLATVPEDPGRAATLIDGNSLQGKTEIRLVSAIDDEPNDLALASVARREGFDYLLRGEVIQDRDPHQGAPREPELKISWRLTPLDVEHAAAAKGKPVVVDVDSAVDRYPDLGLIQDADTVLAKAAVRDTFRLVTPYVDRQRVQLAIAYGLPGSKELRRGNAAALAGRWAEAESIWRGVLETHPAQIAAIHNLALAAAAGQDFSRAKQLARRAIRLQPSPLHKKTLVWIELKQRDYHRSFGLPDPPEGWFLTRSK